jgi:hypothetical protein
MNTTQTIRKIRLLKTMLALLLVGLLLVIAQRSAWGARLLEPSADYELPHYSLSAGSGAWAEGSGYSLGAALSPLEGGIAYGEGYTLTGGVLSGAGEAGVVIYIPIARR